MSYKLHKISIEEGKGSAVRAGAIHRGSTLGVGHYLSKEKLKLTDSLDDVREGLQVLVTQGWNYVHTSPIQEILERTEGMVRFRTETSVYELTREEDTDERD